MAEITLWLVRGNNYWSGHADIALLTNDPMDYDPGKMMDTRDDCVAALSVAEAKQISGCDLQPGEKVKLTVTVGRRQKARKG